MTGLSQAVTWMIQPPQLLTAHYERGSMQQLNGFSPSTKLIATHTRWSLRLRTLGSSYNILLSIMDTPSLQSGKTRMIGGAGDNTVFDCSIGEAIPAPNASRMYLPNTLGPSESVVSMMLNASESCQGSAQRFPDFSTQWLSYKLLWLELLKTPTSSQLLERRSLVV